VKDFAPVTLVAANPNLMLVHPSLPVRNVQELIGLAKRRPGELTFGSSGTGTSPYLSMELFKQMAGIDMVHVPYKGSAPAVQDLVGGHVQLMFGATATVMSYVKANRLRTIAVTSPERIAAMPEIPTVAESGLPGFEARTWYGVLARHAPPPTSCRSCRSRSPPRCDNQTRPTTWRVRGLDAIANRPEEFAEVIRADMQKWGKVIAAIRPLGRGSVGRASDPFPGTFARLAAAIEKGGDRARVSSVACSRAVSAISAA